APPASLISAGDRFADVLDLHRRASRTQARFELHLAAWVGDGHDVCLRRDEVVELFLEDAFRHRGLESAVEAGRTTADVGMAHLDQAHARQRSDQVPWLLLDALRVSEVTGILVSDLQVDLMCRLG